MSEHNFLNIHVLISHAASCVNRDNNNLQKHMVFGGVTRARVSSQSLKYAIRGSSYYQKKLGEASDRTREIGALADEYVEQLKSKYSPELIRKTISLASADGEKDTQGNISAKEITSESQSGSIIPWSLAEVAGLCEIVKVAEKEGLSHRQLTKRIADNKNELRKALASSVDIALSGRMTTSGLLDSVEAGMALAHSFTTHQHTSQLDWFTAVDDFSDANSGKTTAGHIGTQDFATGTFYRYCSVNVPLLAENLGNDKAKALEVCSYLVYLLSTVVPKGKQNSFAAFNYADYILASFSDEPISLSDAFEKPVQKDREGGFTETSINGLESYFEKLKTAYAIESKDMVFNLFSEEKKPSISKLQEWVKQGH